MTHPIVSALPHYQTSTWALIIVAVVVLVSVAAAYLGQALARRGRREPLIVKLINRTRDRVISAVKRPITIAVLDEVADVLRTGNYTRNVSAALYENRVELRQMITEKVMSDPAAGRSLEMLPFHARIVEELTEAALRIVMQVLEDPRTDELVSDVLRDNIDQIRAAVRAVG